VSGAGATRSEIVATAAVVVLAVIAVWVLWPQAPDRDAAPAPGVAESDPLAADPAALASARAAANLPPCPGPAGPDTPRGPLSGVTVPCLGGPGAADLGATTAGRTVLINLWASWCAPCRTELPALAEYATRPDAAAVLTVNVRDDPVAALRLLAELNVRLPAVADPDGDVRAALRAPPALPASYVLRPDGTATRVEPPTPFRTAEEIAAAVRRLD